MLRIPTPIATSRSSQAPVPSPMPTTTSTYSSPRSAASTDECCFISTRAKPFPPTSQLRASPPSHARYSPPHVTSTYSPPPPAPPPPDKYICSGHPPTHSHLPRPSPPCSSPRILHAHHLSHLMIEKEIEMRNRVIKTNDAAL